jgi:hypothetical protein
MAVFLSIFPTQSLDFNPCLTGLFANILLWFIRFILSGVRSADASHVTPIHPSYDIICIKPTQCDTHPSGGSGGRLAGASARPVRGPGGRGAAARAAAGRCTKICIKPTLYKL